MSYNLRNGQRVHGVRVPNTLSQALASSRANLPPLPPLQSIGRPWGPPTNQQHAPYSWGQQQQEQKYQYPQGGVAPWMEEQQQQQQQQQHQDHQQQQPQPQFNYANAQSPYVGVSSIPTFESSFNDVESITLVVCSDLNIVRNCD